VILTVLDGNDGRANVFVVSREELETREKVLRATEIRGRRWRRCKKGGNGLGWTMSGR
jgi:hypothetical protein